MENSPEYITLTSRECMTFSQLSMGLHGNVHAGHQPADSLYHYVSACRFGQHSDCIVCQQCVSPAIRDAICKDQDWCLEPLMPSSAYELQWLKLADVQEDEIYPYIGEHFQTALERVCRSDKFKTGLRA